MAERKTLSKKLRFEVFKRDKFTCQYCGRAAPDVVLEVDHIQPVSKDGDDDILNLVTSCRDCNAGKGARELSDESVVAKKRAQLEDLQERREQIEMMMDWQRELTSLDEETVDQLASLWAELVPGFYLNDTGRHGLKKLVQQYSVAEIGDAMRNATAQRLEIDADGRLKKESVESAWDYVGRICRFKRRNADKPYMRDLFYIRGIMRKRFSYVSEWESIHLLEKAYLAGIGIEELRALVTDCRNWSQWCRSIESWIKEAGEE